MKLRGKDAPHASLERRATFFAQTGRHEGKTVFPRCDLAQQFEAFALSDDYFLSRKLYPNLDFYSGLIYQAMGYPPNMFTVLYALGRLPGWIAHWREMINDPATKIGRPRQVYTGPTQRDYVPIADR